MKKVDLARLALDFAAVAALAGCGGGSSPAPSPVPVPPPPPPVAAKATAFAPADGAASVGIHSTLTIAFDAALDPASVTSATVTLGSHGIPVPTTLAYDDATHTIILQPPPQGLEHAGRFDLAISGLRDAHGLPVASASASFTTWLNHKLSVDQQGEHRVYAYDDQGRFTGWSSYAATPPGHEYGRRVITFSADGLHDTVTDLEPGPDGAFLTADDMVDLVMSNTEDAQGRALASDAGWSGRVLFKSAWTWAPDGTLAAFSSVQPGADGTFGGLDDTGFAERYTYDAFGRKTGMVHADGAWPDPTAFTDADVRSFADSSRSADGSSLHWTDRGVGLDGLMHTADDLVYDTRDDTFDAHGNLLLSVTRDARATVTTWTATVYDANDNRASSTTYAGPGPDGTWFTEDDDVGSVTTFDTAH